MQEPKLTVEDIRWGEVVQQRAFFPDAELGRMVFALKIGDRRDYHVRRRRVLHEKPRCLQAAIFLHALVDVPEQVVHGDQAEDV